MAKRSNESSPSPKRLKIEADNDQNAENNANGPQHLTLQKMYDTCLEVLEKQKNIEKSNKEIVEKLRLTDEKLESIQLQLESDRVDETTATSSNSLDREGSVKSTSSSGSSPSTISSENIPTTGKYFVLKHKFKNMSKMKEDDEKYSKAEEHFGVEWKMEVCREKEHIGFFLICLKPEDTDNWTIETQRKGVFISNRVNNEETTDTTIFDNNSGLWGWTFIEWKVLEKDFLVDDQLTAAIHVKIKKTTGIYKDNLRSFDETMEEFSDVVLVVNEQKFYVLKKFLALHSSYFKSLFLGQFQESKKSEIELTGIDTDDFQNYLELLYGDNSIDEITVEGILMVADMYDTPLVIGKCEKFLLNESEKTLKKKLQMSVKYHLGALKQQCLDSIDSVADIRSVLPQDGSDLDPSIMRELLEKSLTL